MICLYCSLASCIYLHFLWKAASSGFLGSFTTHGRDFTASQELMKVDCGIPFSQLLVQIPGQGEGNQAWGPLGRSHPCIVLLLQLSLMLCPQPPGQLLWLQLPLGPKGCTSPLLASKKVTFSS